MLDRLETVNEQARMHREAILKACADGFTSPEARRARNAARRFLADLDRSERSLPEAAALDMEVGEAAIIDDLSGETSA